MPGMSGIEFQRRLLAQGCHLPIIFITAFPEEDIRMRVIAAGAIGFLSKLFKDKCLIDCLDSTLRSRGLGSVKQ